MSHYSKIKTNLADKDALLLALCDLGFDENKVEQHETPAHLYGYHGDRREQTAHIIIRRNFVGSLSNDIGFIRQADGSYQAIISEYDEKGMGYNQKWLARLTQRYSYHVVAKKAQLAGFQLLEVTDKDGQLHLTFERPKLTQSGLSGF